LFRVTFEARACAVRDEGRVRKFCTLQIYALPVQRLLSCSTRQLSLRREQNLLA